MSRDKQTGFHISKESVDKLFPKKDIDILGYESPIHTFIGQMHIEYEQILESAVIKAVRAIDVTVDKEELIKALQYDRNQYEKGYINGYNAKASDVAEELERYLRVNEDIALKCKEENGEQNREYWKGKLSAFKQIRAYIDAELKKKYTKQE